MILLQNYLINIIFGNYLNREDNIYLCKLKNRGLNKKEELKVNDISYSILAEDIIELPQNSDENEIVKSIRNIYINLKLEVDEAKRSNTILNSSIPFEYVGNMKEYRKIIKLFSQITHEIEYYFSKILNRKVKIQISRGKTITYFAIREAY